MKTFFISVFLLSSLCFALDNPDSPDYVYDFKNRVKPVEEAIFKNAKTTLDFIEGYKRLEKTLNIELDSAHKKLMDKLSPLERQKYLSSQEQWEKFRDMEFKFISNNWNAINFGSSSHISVGSYRTSIIKNRVIQLLKYLRNY